MKVRTEPFGTTKSGTPVLRYILENGNGMQVSVLDYACVIQSILLPRKGAEALDVVLGYDSLADYEAGSCFFGSFVGRYANRIKGAQFQLNGNRYTLEQNDGNNHLHGIYCKQVFSGDVKEDWLVLRRTSPDGEEGYPGTLSLEVRYHLNEQNGLEMEYWAQTDAPTVLNLTNHSYFNLNGQDGSTVLTHKLTLSAGSFTEGDAETLPTGVILPVDGTPMDFRRGKEIGAELFAEDPQLTMCLGYDHNLILNGRAGELRWFATAESGPVRMDCYTTQPAVQLYTGNYVDNDTAACGKGGVRYPRYGGFCLETQHYPCAPNFPTFPSTVLNPGEVYQEKTVYQFHFIEA